MRACQGTTSNLHNSQAAQPEESMDNTEYVNDEVETIGSQRMEVKELQLHATNHAHLLLHLKLPPIVNVAKYLRNV